MDEKVFATSATTWRDVEAPSRLLEGLNVALVGGPWRRIRSFRRRHQLRTETARAASAEARAPRSGFPVATSSQALGFLGGLLRGRRAVLVWAIALNLVAAGAGLVAPFLLGRLIDRVTGGVLDQGALTTTVSIIAGVIVAQAFLTFAARRASAVFGYDVLAAAREEVVRIVLRLPLGRVESSGTGDLLTRITTDVGHMAIAARWALPNLIVSVVLIGATLVAMLVNSWVLTLPMLGTALVMTLGGRYYLRRATAGYITESQTYSVINSTTTETVEGARTVEALGLGDIRIAQIDEDTEVSGQAERYTLTLRNILFAMVDSSFQLPLIGVVLLGVWGHTEGWVTVGQITTAALYISQLQGPLDRVIQVLDHLQLGMVATARLIGVAQLEDDRTPGGGEPRGVKLTGTDLKFGYRDGVDVLHGINVDLQPVNDSPSWGPPAPANRHSPGWSLGSTDPARAGSRLVASTSWTFRWTACEQKWRS